MSGSNFSVEADGPKTLRQKAASMAAAVKAWASTEVGGWIIVGVLAFAALTAVAVALIAPRLAEAPVLTADGRVPVTAAPGAAAALDDFTLAPDAVQNLSHEQARLWNEGLPYSTDPIRPARPLIAPTTDIEAYGRALDCLTTAIYYEAASETPQGQAAVAQVVLNRVRHPAYPRTVCGVVFQGSERTTGCQFSFTCDGAMARVPSTAGWARARAVASAALNGTVVNAVGTATHYHTDWVAPYWAPRLSKIVKIGTHIFYRWNGAWGLPTAFTGLYVGAEPIEPKMIGLTTIQAPPPAEILDIPPLPPMDITSTSEPTSQRLTIPVTVETEASQDAVSNADEETLAAPTPVATAPVAQRDTPIVRDPLANPAQPQRQRPRIAAPSNW